MSFPHLIALSSWAVSESSSQSIAHPYLGLLFASLFVLTCRLTASVADPDLERLALHALIESLAVARISGKEAAILLGMSEGQWTEVCQGKRHLPSINRLLNLPWPFWQAFLPSLAYLLTKKKVRELVTDERRSA